MPLQSVKELIAYNGAEDLLRDLLDRFSSFSGISGVHPKVLIKDTKPQYISDNKPRVTVKGSTHIVKASDKTEYPDLAENEFFCMKVAKRAGLDVPNISLSENNVFLIVERFDLNETSEYIGFEDFCTLSGLGAKSKHDKSYEYLARQISSYVSPEFRSKSLEVLFRSIAVSSVLRNGDARLKNFGVLYESTDMPVQLASTYDIVTTTPYIKSDAFALTMEGSKRFPDARNC